MTDDQMTNLFNTHGARLLRVQRLRAWRGGLFAAALGVALVAVCVAVWMYPR